MSEYKKHKDYAVLHMFASTVALSDSMRIAYGTVNRTDITYGLPYTDHADSYINWGKIQYVKGLE